MLTSPPHSEADLRLIHLGQKNAFATICFKCMPPEVAMP